MTTTLVPNKSLAELEQTVERLMRATLAPNTWKSYRVGCRLFAEWCEAHGLASMPAEPTTMCLYIAYMAERYTASTITSRLRAVNAAHEALGYPNPTVNEQVRRVWRGVRRAKGVAQRQKAAISIDQLRTMVQALPDSTKGKRDRALILVGFLGAFRRGELMSLTVEQVKFTKEGLFITLPRSKTDQAGQGTHKGIPCAKKADACPVRALRAWLDASNIKSGPIFRPVNRHGQIAERALTGHAAAIIVKEAAAAVGMEGDFSGLSLRAGFATAAIEAGMTIPEVMRQTGHKQPETLLRYVRHASVWRDNPAAKLGL